MERIRVKFFGSFLQERTPPRRAENKKSHRLGNKAVFLYVDKTRKVLVKLLQKLVGYKGQSPLLCKTIYSLQKVNCREFSALYNNYLFTYLFIYLFIYLTLAAGRYLSCKKGTPKNFACFNLLFNPISAYRLSLQ